MLPVVIRPMYSLFPESDQKQVQDLVSFLQMCHLLFHYTLIQFLE